MVGVLPRSSWNPALDYQCKTTHTCETRQLGWATFWSKTQCFAGPQALAPIPQNRLGRTLHSATTKSGARTVKPKSILWLQGPVFCGCLLRCWQEVHVEVHVQRGVPAIQQPHSPTAGNKYGWVGGHLPLIALLLLFGSGMLNTCGSALGNGARSRGRTYSVVGFAQFRWFGRMYYCRAGD